MSRILLSGVICIGLLVAVWVAQAAGAWSFPAGHDPALTIRDAQAFCGDLGYPASCVLPSGELLTAYYQKPGKKDPPCLMATKWRVTR